MNMITSKNETWGFFGTMGEHAETTWPIALAAIVNATGCSPEDVGTFLDSRHGRHFANDVNNAMHHGEPLAKAIKTATTQWMASSIGRKTANEYGIPYGLPYMTGWVMHCAILAETI